MKYLHALFATAALTLLAVPAALSLSKAGANTKCRLPSSA